MKKIIIGNWKMNPATAEEAAALFDAIKLKAESWKLKAEVVVCPPFIYLSQLKGLTLGAQNVSLQEKGAFTGQISAGQLKDLGVEYVIMGHSEVRKHLGETDEVINKKVMAVLGAGLKPVLCVGENESEDRNAVLEKQLAGFPDFSNMVIAYEPVWAIGTGKNCDTKSVAEAVGFIKKIAGDVRVIYGGSVNATNAADYLKNGGVDGLLPGGASLKPEEFVKIVQAAQ